MSRKQDKLKVISAKDLGRLNMPDFCPRCFWLERHIDKPPAIFPGIFSTLDALTKRSAHRSFSSKGVKPGWLPIDDIVEIEEGDIYFKLPVEWGDWILTGWPDDIFKTRDNAYHIIDYKTAKFTERQDELLPLYEAQLNGYAFLAEQYGYRPVSRLSLAYCQPNDELVCDDDFQLGFSVHSLDIDINKQIVQELLLKARDLLNHDEPPDGRKGCSGICHWADKAVARLIK